MKARTYTDKQLLDALESRVSEDRPWQYWVSVYWAPTLRETLALILEDPRGYQKNRTKKEIDAINKSAEEASSRNRRRKNQKSNRSSVRRTNRT